MVINRIIAELQVERARLAAAISAIEELDRTVPRRGRPAGTRRRGRLSAAARKRISDAQKARWAKQRKGR